MHFPETSIENLLGFGYTEDEARFLYLVATHSGYFCTRQYLAFTGAKSGDKSVAFTQKVLGKGHATARLLLRNGRVYHLFSRLVYRAIARENLRNRREHSVISGTNFRCSSLLNLPLLPLWSPSVLSIRGS